MTITSGIRKFDVAAADSPRSTARVAALLEDAGRAAREAATTAVRLAHSAATAPRVRVQAA